MGEKSASDNQSYSLYKQRRIFSAQKDYRCCLVDCNVQDLREGWLLVGRMRPEWDTGPYRHSRSGRAGAEDEAVDRARQIVAMFGVDGARAAARAVLGAGQEARL